MKVLIIKMSSMGDVVHALPLLSDVAQRYPDAQIDWVVEQGFADLVRSAAPLVRRVIPIRLRAWRKTWRTAQTRQEWRVFKNTLQSEAYDVVLDCQGLLKSALIARLARLAPNGKRVGYDKNSIREPIASYFYSQKYAVSRQLSAVVRNRSLCAQAFGYSVDNKPQANLTALDNVATPRDDWRNPTAPYVVLIPNASRVEKRWAAEYWQAIAAQCHAAGLRTVWFWAGADELVYTQTLLDGLSPDDAHLPPFLTIPQAAQSMQNARAVVGLDSGLTHLAAALGKPTLGIFCDHDPLLAPMTAHTQGDEYVASLGGVGKPPSLASVQSVLQAWL